MKTPLVMIYLAKQMLLDRHPSHLITTVTKVRCVPYFYIILCYSKAYCGIKRICCLKRSITLPKCNNRMALLETIWSITCWTVPITSRYWKLEGSWKSLSWKTLSHLSRIINVIAIEYPHLNNMISVKRAFTNGVFNVAHLCHYQRLSMPPP